MPFDPTPKVQELKDRLNAFMARYIYPNEQRHVKEAEQYLMARSIRLHPVKV